MLFIFLFWIALLFLVVVGTIFSTQLHRLSTQGYM
jgi:hypothetical protein